MILALSRFPSEVRKDKLFIGNLTNVMSKDLVQLKMLKCMTIVYLTPEPMPELEKDFDCIHFPVKLFNKDLEMQSFEPVVDKIEEIHKTSEYPVFLFCVNGFLSSAIACQYLMRVNSTFSKELAMASVMAKRYENKDMPGWLYSMI